MKAAYSLQIFFILIYKYLNANNKKIFLVDIPVNLFDELNLIDQNSVAYLAGFFARKILNRHNCDTCREIIVAKADAVLNPEYAYINQRQYINTESLIKPSEQFINYILRLGKSFQENFQKPELYAFPSVAKKIFQLT